MLKPSENGYCGGERRLFNTASQVWMLHNDYRWNRSTWNTDWCFNSFLMTNNFIKYLPFHQKHMVIGAVELAFWFIFIWQKLLNKMWWYTTERGKLMFMFQKLWPLKVWGYYLIATTTQRRNQAGHKLLSKSALTHVPPLNECFGELLWTHERVYRVQMITQY